MVKNKAKTIEKIREIPATKTLVKIERIKAFEFSTALQ